MISIPILKKACKQSEKEQEERIRKKKEFKIVSLFDLREAGGEITD